MDAVHRYEGTVSRLMGDGLMAMFGAPVAHEDHAVRACYAALAMLEAVRAYAEDVRQTSGATIQIRVGLNSGEVIVRLISDDLHMDYTAMGQTVHLASRMESLASAGSALLTPSTLTLVDGLVDARPLGPMLIRGLEQPLEVYELVGSGAARTRLEAAATRGFTAFVGRRRELEMIQVALQRASAGRGQMVALVGEPGVGKSRVVYEAIQAASASGWLVLHCGGLSYGQATAYLPIVDLLKGYCGIGPGDDVKATHERVTTRLTELDPTLEAILTPLLSLLDLPTWDDSWATLDPPRRRRAIHAAVRRLLLRLSESQPLLLVVEDLHWIDSETQALLDGLVENVLAAKLVLLVNYRPEYTHGWGSKSVYTQVRIDPLETASAGQLLRSLLGGDDVLDPLKQHLIERTGGNPLFLEEMVRSLVETSVLVGRRGNYTVTQDVGEVHVPASVQVILAARIDRLEPEAKQLIQTAAVIGKDVPFELFREVAEISADALHGLLSRLQSAELLYPTRLFPEPAYTFKHALTHDVAYGSLLHDRRMALHARIVAALETLYANRLDEHAERLAHHALQGGLWESAVTYCRRAGEKSIAHWSNREAVAHFDRGLAALTHLPERRDTLEQAIDLRLNLRSALHALGEWQRLRSILHEAEAFAERLGDQLRLGQVSATLVSNYWRQGDHRRAVELARRALAASEASGSVGLRIHANYALAMTYRELGAYRQALDVLAWNRMVLANEPVRATFGSPTLMAVASRAEAALCLADLGEFTRGIELGEEAVWLAEDLDHRYSAILARQHLGQLYVRRGVADAAIAVLEPGLTLCRSLEVISLVPGSAAGLGAAYSLAGRVSEGTPLLEAAVREGTSHGMMTETSRQATWLGEAHLAAGRLADATRLAMWALDLAVSHDERGHRTCALHLLGEIAASRVPTHADQAEARYREALALADMLEMRPLQARCHLGLGKLLRRVGRLDEARAELATAVAMLRKMGMAFWLPEAESELMQANASRGHPG